MVSKKSMTEFNTCHQMVFQQTVPTEQKTQRFQWMERDALYPLHHRCKYVPGAIVVSQLPLIGKRVKTMIKACYFEMQTHSSNCSQDIFSTTYWHIPEARLYQRTHLLLQVLTRQKCNRYNPLIVVSTQLATCPKTIPMYLKKRKVIILEYIQKSWICLIFLIVIILQFYSTYLVRRYQT